MMKLLKKINVGPSTDGNEDANPHVVVSDLVKKVDGAMEIVVMHRAKF